MKKLTHALIGAAVLAAISSVAPASAMPVAGLATAVQEQSTDLQNVRWVWVPGRACWRCGFYRRPYWGGYRPFYWRRPVFWGVRRPVFWGVRRPFFGGFRRRWWR